MARWLIAAFLSLLVVPADAFESRVLRLTHDGVEREALIDVRRDTRNGPVLFVLHGGIAGARTVRSRARVGLAREGWVVVWPSAVNDWNDGRTDFFGRPHDTEDDLGYFRRLISDLAEAGVADPSRVYFAGPSIGGVMVLRLLCDAPDLVAGAAVAIASLPDGGECKDGPPRPVVYIHGTDDGIMPPDGGRIGGSSPFVRDRGRVEPVADTVASLADRNKCMGFEETRLPDVVADDGSTVALRKYTGCAAPLVHYIVEGGGHTWPGSRRSGLGRALIGATNQDISATRIVEEFFKDLDARR